MQYLIGNMKIKIILLMISVIAAMNCFAYLHYIKTAGGKMTAVDGKITGQTSGWTDPNQDTWLFAHFFAETNTVEPVAPDSSAYTNDLYINQDTTAQPTRNAATENTNAYYSFDGTTDFMYSKEPVSLTYKTNVTFSAWVRGALPDAIIMILATKDTNNAPYNANIGFGYHNANNGQISLDFRHDAANRYAFLTNAMTYITATNWHFLVAACDFNDATEANRVRIYVDGIERPEKLISALQKPLGIMNTNFYVGSLSVFDSPRRFWAGAIYRSVIYNKTLSSNEQFEVFLNSAPAGTNRLETIP